MYPKSSILIWKTILLYITKIIRNVLYVPYVTALILYLFIFFVLIIGTILSNNAGVDFINSIIKFLFKINILNENMDIVSKTYTVEETTNIILFIIIGFGVLYDLFERFILYFNKKLNRLQIRKRLFKFIFWLYGVTFFLDSILIIFLVKDFMWFGVLIIIILLNAILLFFVYLISIFFGRVYDLIENNN